MCLYPRIIANKKYLPNKKNGGIIPAILDNRVLAVPIACGECIECRKKKAREWTIRLMEEVKTNKNGHFVTLTFSNESIKELYNKEDIKGLKGYEKDNAAAKKAIRLFLERWRKKYKKSVRHWLITELGHKGTENIHIHGIIWTDESAEEIKNIWQYGYIWAGYNGKRTTVTERTINYIIKYVNKLDKERRYYKPVICTSAGIGNKYTESNQAKDNIYKTGNTKETYKTKTGHKIAMPVYWRNKIYTEEEREKLWIEKLDKKERWVCGEKIDISKGEEEYYRTLKYYQNKNNQLGYGNNQKNWKQMKYEEERRTWLQMQREKATTL